MDPTRIAGLCPALRLAIQRLPVLAQCTDDQELLRALFANPNEPPLKMHGKSEGTELPLFFYRDPRTKKKKKKGVDELRGFSIKCISSPKARMENQAWQELESPNGEVHCRSVDYNTVLGVAVGEDHDLTFMVYVQANANGERDRVEHYYFPPLEHLRRYHHKHLSRDDLNDLYTALRTPDVNPPQLNRDQATMEVGGRLLPTYDYRFLVALALGPPPTKLRVPRPLPATAAPQTTKPKSGSTKNNGSANASSAASPTDRIMLDAMKTVSAKGPASKQSPLLPSAVVYEGRIYPPDHIKNALPPLESQNLTRFSLNALVDHMLRGTTPFIGANLRVDDLLELERALAAGLVPPDHASETPDLLRALPLLARQFAADPAQSAKFAVAAVLSDAGAINNDAELAQKIHELQNDPDVAQNPQSPIHQSVRHSLFCFALLAMIRETTAQ